HSIAHDDLIERVASGEIDYSVVNECDLNDWEEYRIGIRRIFVLRNNVELVYVARREAGGLIGKLNRHLEELNITPPDDVKTFDLNDDTGNTADASTDDLDVIKKRGFIRMLTTNDFFTCHLHKGGIRGFEYELADRFAKDQNLAVVTIIPAEFEELPKLLAEGKGDFIAANFTMTPERVHAFKDLAFCAPYGEVTQILVGRPDADVSRLSDLAGKKIHARPGKNHFDTLRKMQLMGADFTIVPIKEDNSAFFALRQVSDGKIDFTVADDVQFQLAVNQGFRIKKLMTLSPRQSFAWVVRKNNPRLAAAVNKFFKKENKSTFFNLCKKRYYGAKEKQPESRIVAKNRLLVFSPYDDLFKKYGEIYHFLWYFLVAQAYKESRFNASLVNSIGAAGLMQVMPDTAKELGITNLTDPENGIAAGTKYMAKLREHFTDAATPRDVLCFTLAAYNAGLGHVLDARKLAKQQGLDPRVWFNHTEKALELLQYRKYSKQAKYGYCRSSETLPYVRDIMLQVLVYWEILETEKKRLSETEKGKNNKAKE
ncbi:MAG: transporter substrate-binding domain-containing protein, partial [Victivallaceae bacterium]|nr:transporter substrate-binding domain-containing protein [Victivallaceae bacterium]